MRDFFKLHIPGYIIFVDWGSATSNKWQPEIHFATFLAFFELDSWRRNWEKLNTYFQYSGAIRKLIYTTNTIEGFHRQVRKVTKTKGALL